MTENKTEEFWGPGSQRDKLVDFYRAIKSRDSYVKPLTDEEQLTEACKLAKDLIDYYDASPEQLKTMLQSAEWTPENIETVLDQKESSDPGMSV